jgi:hypothetical protein
MKTILGIDYLSKKEVAEAFSVCGDTVDYWRINYDFRQLKLGGDGFTTPTHWLNGCERTRL